ncbi:flavodoxin family protein [Prolixibacteraceae bacterium Z1-6]|uniref:Flavodoxin family protein n=1 Tax=Draconibacterium aestuarii TaxID=2998507 RepID=A0A9X3F6J7_9BACT|nr:flavodoxin family protein [Prolixibacteraceae bacterium Z1-6]
MKVIAFNGSPIKEGNTHSLIQAFFNVLNPSGIETEEINIGLKPVNSCLSCYKCMHNQDKKCAQTKDKLNDYIARMEEADGIILASPVYFAQVSGQMKNFIDRAGFVCSVNGGLLKHKVGAALVAVRRAGALPAFHTMNDFFSYAQIHIVGSTYWNIGFGLMPDEINADAEGQQTIRNLARNMVWLLKSIDAAKIPLPETELGIWTNMVREDLMGN